jgi:fatty-acyl-CoA synthase
MIEGLEQRHGLNVVHAWGMTEMTPLGAVSHLPVELAGAPADVRNEYRTKQGLAAPLVEMRARNDDGLAPRDGVTTGELEVRGPWVAGSYYDATGTEDGWTDDGWFRTGDVVTLDELGYMKITDRAKDLIKSGGEWISSMELEAALMTHPAVVDAAVVAVPHERWQERPLAVVVLRPSAVVEPDELRAHLAGSFAKWWLPDAFVFVDELPKTAVGKVRKGELRERFGLGIAQ